MSEQRKPLERLHDAMEEIESVFHEIVSVDFETAKKSVNIVAQLQREQKGLEDQNAYLGTQVTALQALTADLRSTELTPDEKTALAIEHADEHLQAAEQEVARLFEENQHLRAKYGLPVEVEEPHPAAVEAMLRRKATQERIQQLIKSCEDRDKQIADLTAKLKDETEAAEHYKGVMAVERQQRGDLKLKLDALQSTEPIVPEQTNAHYNINDNSISMPIQMTGIPMFIFMVDGVPMIERPEGLDILVSDFLAWLNKEMGYIRKNFGSPYSRIALEYYRHAYETHDHHLMALQIDPESTLTFDDAYRKAAQDFATARQHCAVEERVTTSHNVKAGGETDGHQSPEETV